jgi:MFS transporter, SP family, galactose:H+ symporter
MAVALAALGLAFRLTGLIDNLGVVSMIGLMIDAGAFATSLGPIFWRLIAEIYPVRVGGLAAAGATTANQASNLLVSLTFLAVAEVLGLSTTLWVYGLLTVAAIVFAYNLVPDTRGRSLEAIQASSRSPGGMPSAASPAPDNSLGRAA